MKQMFHFALVLGAIAVIAALGISGVYELTHKRVAEKEAVAFQEALRSIFPEAGSFVPLTEYSAGEVESAWAGKDDEGVGVALGADGPLGYLAVGYKQGYSSRIKVLVGSDSDFQIVAIRILYAAETPGLGEQAKEVKSDRTVWQAAAELVSLGEPVEAGDSEPWFQSRFKGKNLDTLVVVKDASQEGIQAITAATVTSKAVTDAVRAALAEIKQKVSGGEAGDVQTTTAATESAGDWHEDAAASGEESEAQTTTAATEGAGDWQETEAAEDE